MCKNNGFYGIFIDTLKKHQCCSFVDDLYSMEYFATCYKIISVTEYFANKYECIFQCSIFKRACSEVFFFILNYFG